jgi:hypothetical protein
VPSNVGERGKLFVDREDVLEDAERGEDETETSRREIEGDRRPGDQAEVRRRRLATENAQHLRRGIDTDAGHARRSNRKEDASGAAANLEDVATGRKREVAIERAIAASVAKSGVVGVVSIGLRPIVVDGHRAAPSPLTVTTSSRVCGLRRCSKT